MKHEVTGAPSPMNHWPFFTALIEKMQLSYKVRSLRGASSFPQEKEAAFSPPNQQQVYNNSKFINVPLTNFRLSSNTEILLISAPT